jgi:glucose/arabinose dehydrogenase/mono/diheme cytochrome c family protein
LKKMKKLSFSCLSFLLASYLAGFGPVMTVSGQPDSGADSIYAEAERLYKQLCAGCHGTEVRAFISPGWKYGTTAADIQQSIREGRGNGAMPAFGDALTREQVEKLTAYLQYGFRNFDRYDFDDEKFIDGVFESESMKFKLEKVADGLEIPWGMAFLPDGSMLITEKKGTLIRLYPDGKKENILHAPEVISRSQGGLLDIELHPGYVNNGWVYISYSKFKPGEENPLSTTAVSRFRLKGNRLADEKMIFEAQDYAYTRHHYGCRLAFDREGYLYISMGDRGAGEVHPQDLGRYPGKIHRVKDDGSIPESNPFVDREDAVKSIFSWGHRNTQGMALHPVTGEMWTHEHGPRGGDEINILKPGANYGWPLVSYGINYDGTVFTELTEKEGMENPIHYWVPSIAPCGMAFVTGDRYPGWKGDLLVGSLKFSYLNLCHLEGNKVVSEEILLKNIGRLRNVKQGPDGYMYVAVEGPGRIYRLVPVE